MGRTYVTIPVPYSQKAKVKWQINAACADDSTDIEAFFGPDREDPKKRHDRESRAVAVCQSCPVRFPCRDFAIANGLRHGVWGGMTQSELQTVTSVNGRSAAGLSYVVAVAARKRDAINARLLAGEKTCPACNKTVPLTDFGSDASKPDGHTTQCRSCRSRPARRSKAKMAA